MVLCPTYVKDNQTIGSVGVGPTISSTLPEECDAVQPVHKRAGFGRRIAEGDSENLREYSSCCPPNGIPSAKTKISSAPSYLRCPRGGPCVPDEDRRAPDGLAAFASRATAPKIPAKTPPIFISSRARLSESPLEEFACVGGSLLVGVCPPSVCSSSSGSAGAQSGAPATSKACSDGSGVSFWKNMAITSV